MSSSTHTNPLLEISDYEPETNVVSTNRAEYASENGSEKSDVNTTEEDTQKEDIEVTNSGFNWKSFIVASISMVFLSFFTLYMTSNNSNPVKEMQVEEVPEQPNALDRLEEKHRVEKSELIARQKRIVDDLKANAAAQLAAERTALAEKVRQEMESKFLAERKVLEAKREESVENLRVQMQSKIDLEISERIAEQDKLLVQVEKSKKRETRVLEHETVSIGEYIEPVLVSNEKKPSQPVTTPKPVKDGSSTNTTTSSKSISAVAEQEQLFINERLERLQTRFFAELEKLALQQKNEIKQAKSTVEGVSDATGVTPEPPQARPSNFGTDQISTLFDRVGSGNVTYLQKYLKRGGSPDQLSESGEPLLVRAAKNDQYIIVSELLRAGANVDLADRNGENALKYASIYGHTGIVALLVTEGANVNFSNTQSESALIAASKNGFDGIVEVLVAAGAK